MIVIYTERVTNRLKYVCNFVFRIYFQVDYILTDKTIDVQKDDILIQYGDFENASFLRIPAEGLLHEIGTIRTQWNPVLDANQKIFASITNTDSEFISYDIFSAVFYCLSMYQAYGTVPKDQHQRIDFISWNLRILNLDKTPIVEQWLLEFKTLLLKLHPNIFFPKRNFKAEISFDIDDPFLFKHKPFFNHLKSFTADILKVRPSIFINRIKTLSGLSDDPSVHFLQLLQENPQVDYRFFILMKSGNFDSKSLQGNDKKELVLQLSKLGKIGLHPSYDADHQPELITSQKEFLESILELKVITSRQHFLRISIPGYFQSLIKLGITDDFTVGYYDQPGFMAGVSIPFYFYDLSNEVQTNLLLHPFVWMDSMYKYYADSSQKDQVFNDFEQILMSLKTLNGCFHAVFHNDTFFNKNPDESIQKIFSTLSRC